MATTHVLAEQAEKLVAAIAFHQLQSDHGTLTETAIRLALELEREKPTGKLNAKDLFYRKVIIIYFIWSATALTYNTYYFFNLIAKLQKAFFNNGIF